MTGNLLLFNLATDADDPILSFTTNWINRLALHFTTIDVITMRAGRLAVMDNVRVHSVGKEQGYSEARRAAEFYRILGGLLASQRYDACFAHMIELFAVMGAPLLKLRGVPLTLWYTHRQATRLLELATQVCDHIVTAAPDTFPLQTSKLRVLGHGIDTDYFHPRAGAAASGADENSRDKLTRTQQMIISRGGYIVQVARLMAIKHQDTLVRALEQLGDGRAVFVGGTPDGADGHYEHKLRGLAHGLDLGGRVVFVGSQSAHVVREYYRKAILAVNLSPPGLFDKAALESMAMALPTIVTSHAFDPLLGQYQDYLYLDSPENVDGLVGCLRVLLEMPADERTVMGAVLRERVVADHSLDGLMTRLVNVLRTGEP
ncbi:MAG: glycosyltransferase family 4 protein [Anaerolineae bacterium]|nr:glycosyltransferase family 4 protein [Anaerolineae bacterium]